MRKFKYELLSNIKGEVIAKDIPSAIEKMFKDYYSKMINPEVLDFQYMHFTIKEIK